MRNIFNAIESSDIETINSLITEKDFMNFKNDDGQNPLEYAIKLQNYDVIDLLANHLNNQINQVLHKAIESNDKRIVEVFLKNGVDLEINDSNGITPLYLAVKKGYSTIAELLIHEGANVNITNSDEVSLLHQAVLRNDGKIVKLIMDKHDDFNPQDCYGLTPLHYAAKNNLPYMAKLLAEKGADINALNKALKTPLFLAINSPGDHFQVVALLCAIDAKIDLKDPKILDYFTDHIDKLLEIGSVNSSITMSLKILKACDNDTKALYDNLSAKLIKKIDNYATLLKSGYFIDVLESKNPEYISEVLNKLYQSSEEWEKIKNIFTDSDPRLHYSLKSLIHSTKIVKEIDTTFFQEFMKKDISDTLKKTMVDSMSATVKNLAALLTSQSFEDSGFLELGETTSIFSETHRPTSINTKLSFKSNMLSIDTSVSDLESRSLVSRLDCTTPEDLSPLGRKVRASSPAHFANRLKFNIGSIVSPKYDEVLDDAFFNTLSPADLAVDDELSKTLNITKILAQTDDLEPEIQDIEPLGDST